MSTRPATPVTAPGKSNLPVMVAGDFLVAAGMMRWAAAAMKKERIERVKKAHGHPVDGC